MRWNQPALREGSMRAFHVHNQNRVIAFHRWIEGRGQDVIVVATLVENSWFNYSIGFPAQGQWREIFNSDVYQDWVNPQVVGNGVNFGRRASAAWIPNLSEYRNSRQWCGGVCPGLGRNATVPIRSR